MLLSPFIYFGVGFGLFLFFFVSKGGWQAGERLPFSFECVFFFSLPSCFSVGLVHVSVKWILILFFSALHPCPTSLPLFFCLLSWLQMVFAWVCQCTVCARFEAPSLLCALCSFHGCWVYGCRLFPVGIVIILAIMPHHSFC